MNPFTLLYKPKEAVHHYLENPNITKAVLFVLLPGILSLFGLIFYGFNVDYLGEISGLLVAVLAWILSSIAISFVIAVFSRKSIRTDFYGIASAVSLTRFLGAFAVFLFLLVPLLIPTEIFSSVRDFQTGNASLAESTNVISAAMNSDTFAYSLPAVSAVLFLVLVFALVSLYVYYHIISKKVNSNVVVHLIALFCFLFLDVVFMAAIGF